MALVAANHKRMALVGNAVLQIGILDDWYDDGTNIGRSLSKMLSNERDSTGHYVVNLRS